MVMNRSLLFIFITILMWGVWGFFGKLALEKRMAPANVFLAEVITSAVLAVPLFVFAFYRRSGPPLTSANIYGFLSGAALAVGLFFYYLALENTQASVVVPLTASYPVVAALLSFALLGERPSIAQWAGIVLIVLGGGLLLSGPAK